MTPFLRNIKYILFIPLLVLSLGNFMYGFGMILNNKFLIGTDFFCDYFKILPYILTETGKYIINNTGLIIAICITMQMCKSSFVSVIFILFAYYFMLASYNYFISLMLTKELYKEFISSSYLISPFYIIGGVILSVSISNFFYKIDTKDIWNNINNNGVKIYISKTIKALSVSLLIGVFLAFIWVMLIDVIIYVYSSLSNTLYLESFFRGFLNTITKPFGVSNLYDNLLRHTYFGGVFKNSSITGCIYGYENIWLTQIKTANNNLTSGSITAYEYVNNMSLIPAIGYSIINTSYSENKKLVKYLIISLSIVSFIFGYSLAMETILLFTSPFLFFLTAIFSGFISFVVYVFSLYVPVHLITLSGGGILDLIFLGIIPGAYRTGVWIILILCMLCLPLFYVFFVFVIKKYKINCFGRYESESSKFIKFLTTDKLSDNKITYKNYKIKNIIRALGGKKNILSIELEKYSIFIDIREIDKIDKTTLKKNGVAGIFIQNNRRVNIILGVTAPEYYDDFLKYLK